MRILNGCISTVTTETKYAFLNTKVEKELKK
jgi:hypothetical protein